MKCWNLARLSLFYFCHQYVPPFLSKDNTLTSEMQIALFSPLPPKASSGEGGFSTGLPEDAAEEESVPYTLHERFGMFHVCRLEADGRLLKDGLSWFL